MMCSVCWFRGQIITPALMLLNGQSVCRIHVDVVTQSGGEHIRDIVKRLPPLP